MSLVDYIIAYQREKKARSRAEELLEAKSREIYCINKAIQSENDHLVQAEKMASIGQLAAGAAHEINNPISFAISNLETLSEYIEKLQGIKPFVEKLEGKALASFERYKKKHNLDFLLNDINPLLIETRDGLTRVKRIVAGLKEFSHQGTGAFSLCDIHALIEGALRVMMPQTKCKCRIVKNFGDIRLIEGIPEQLSQVFVNLFHNALQAMEGMGTITIQTMMEDNQIVIRVTDTGCGIEPDIISSIFTPFFTTKPIGVGTGLGLSVTYGIINRHKGSISVENSNKNGTTFRINLPIDANI